MTILDIGPAVGSLRTEEEDLLASFTQGLIKIVAVAGGRGTSSSPIAALNAMRLPAIALDQHGFVADANAAADVVFDNDIKIKDRRLFVRDPAARTHLKEVIDRLKDLHRLEFRGSGADHSAPHGQTARHRAHLALRGASAGRACSFDAQCLGTKTGTASGDPRQDIPAYAIGSETRLHHRARRPSRYRGPGIEDFTGHST